ncbi:hypothetical protein O181_102992 [Austropuccinia psidii MF-1]|uniref:Uncharacterized protein n=1 Tax=Austropuccinia psidii MF-1 TaxID=1389203 RepID=A0A9Q3JIY9_9BASI|nr:hypothetical protein [Austropuccinia psidii MF-1]
MSPSSEPSTPKITTHLHSFTIQNTLIQLPQFVFHLTRMSQSMLIWIGTSAGSLEETPTSDPISCLCNDWSCAVPPSSVEYLLDLQITTVWFGILSAVILTDLVVIILSPFQQCLCHSVRSTPQNHLVKLCLKK